MRDVQLALCLPYLTILFRFFHIFTYFKKLLSLAVVTHALIPVLRGKNRWISASLSPAWSTKRSSSTARAVRQNPLLKTTKQIKNKEEASVVVGFYMLPQMVLTLAATLCI